MNIPENFYRYKQMPVWSKKNIPALILNKHNTKAGVYGKINVLKGKILYTTFRDATNEIENEITLEAPNFGVALPQQWHKVTLFDDAEIMVEFFQEKDKKIIMKEKVFNMIFPNKGPHFEVKYLSSLVDNPNEKTALDIGSWLGRNTLWLAKEGFSVESWDKNIDGLEETQELAEKNNLKVQTFEKNLNHTVVEKNYDVIISTVVLQFLEPESAKNILASATAHTNPGGYNLIIAPVQADDFVCPFDFPNLPTYEEYLDFYKDWEIIFADNSVGQFHRKDENGNRVKSRFATILAKKPQ